MIENKKCMKKPQTKICLETPSKNNKYVTENLHLFGYDINELAKQRSFVETLFLMFKGELPTNKKDKLLFETLMIYLSLPSPRHPGSQAAMNSGICKTNAEHILPIALMAIGGKQSGALEVERSWYFIKDNVNKPVAEVVKLYINQCHEKGTHLFPGFGQHFGAIDPFSFQVFKRLFEIKPESELLQWVSELLVELETFNVGILDVGLAAVISYELTFGARESVGLYQLLRAPGLLAYGMEQTHNPVSAIPLLEDSQYELKKQ